MFTLLRSRKEGLVCAELVRNNVIYTFIYMYLHIYMGQPARTPRTLRVLLRILLVTRSRCMYCRVKGCGLGLRVKG